MTKGYSPFKMKGFGGFGNSPAKRADVYIGDENIGTGSEAMKKGLAAEKANLKVPVGLEGTENLKEVYYDKEDAKSRIKMTTGKDRKIFQKEYAKTGKVSGKGTDRAKAAKKETIIKETK